MIKSNPDSSLLGEIQLISTTFYTIESTLTSFKQANFLALSEHDRFEKINAELYRLILEAPPRSFLLSAVIDFIERVHILAIIKEPFKMSSFEFWLNHFSGLSESENHLIRAKIAGKYLPRSDYQSIFPIGMNRFFPGSHFVIAHLSPDIDTMVASFWGWLDAFAARVGTGLHHWFLPEGPPESPFTLMFQKWIGSSVFKYLPQTTKALTLNSLDLVTERSDKLNQQNVADLSTPYVTAQSELEEIRHKIKQTDCLPVVIQEADQRLSLIGIIRAADLNRSSLGTVTFRDFSNFDEVKMPSSLELISVMDHHKTALKTSAVPNLSIADVQSCNILLAEQAFLLNDQYSTGGMTLEQLNTQLSAAASISSPTVVEMRIQQRLLQRAIAAHCADSYYIHPEREYGEYFCFLQAILDDTDLLTKVSVRDLKCIVELLNRLKSLSLGKEVEIISLDDLPHDQHFIRQASQRILQQPDMYSIYKQVYQLREKSVEANLELCMDGQPSNIFVDTKIQNGCARVGQTKLFTQNFPFYSEHAMKVRQLWLTKSKSVHSEQPEVDLYLHMISTIASADEVFNGQVGPYSHLDELWLWIPSNQLAEGHLNSFLTHFSVGVKKALEQVSIELIGNHRPEVIQSLNQLYPNVKITHATHQLIDESMIILRFDAGKLNSRKSMITPFLPRLQT